VYIHWLRIRLLPLVPAHPELLFVVRKIRSYRLTGMYVCDYDPHLKAVLPLGRKVMIFA
jgi:hypothetical protein